jgi:hypothetical protein
MDIDTIKAVSAGDTISLYSNAVGGPINLGNASVTLIHTPQSVDLIVFGLNRCLYKKLQIINYNFNDF